MAQRHPFRAFNGGEITPELYGRAELAPFQTGLAVCRNFEVLPQGAVQNRTGTEYVIHAKFADKACRVIDFEYSAEASLMLEVGDEYIRFHTNGGTIIESGKTITAITADLPGLFTAAAHGYVIGEWVFISGIVGMTELNNRYFIVDTVPTVNTFTLNNLDGTELDTTDFTDYISGGAAYRVYEIATPYLEADLFDLHYTQDNDKMTIVHQDYQQRELIRNSATDWDLNTLSFAASIAAPTGLTVTAQGGAGTTIYNYVVTAIDEDTLEESVASIADNDSSDLANAGNHMELAWNAVSGAFRYNVYSQTTNGVYGYVGETTGLSFLDYNIIPDTTRTPPIGRNPLSGSGNYPRAVEYFEQRRAFAGTTNESQTLFMTRTALDGSFHYSIPSRADDSIIVKLKARKVQTIRHLLPLSDLIALTSGGAFRIDSASSDSVISPNTIRAKPNEHLGASNVQPVLTRSSGFYVQSLGSKIREMAFDWSSDNYQSVDHSTLATHLFDEYTIVDLAYSRGPVPIVWAVRSDGTLLGETFLPEHEVKGWHRHDSEDGDAFFESVSVKQEGEEDVPYFVVRRTIDGSTVRYIERKASRMFATKADAFFVDCGKTYSGAATSTISNLHHLEGKTVAILGDGAVFPEQTVVDGIVTLPDDITVTKAQIGLPITSQIQTLPMIYMLDLNNFGDFMNVNEVTLRVHSAGSVFTGPRLDKLRQNKSRTTEVYGTSPDLFTGIVSVRIDGNWNKEGQIWIQQSDPLPLTVSTILLEPASSE